MGKRKTENRSITVKVIEKEVSYNNMIEILAKKFLEKDKK